VCERLGRRAAPPRRLCPATIAEAYRTLRAEAAAVSREAAAVVAKNVDRTTAHRDHIHFGLSWAGARKRTSFWLPDAD
jgi:hypothetical protein